MKLTRKTPELHFLELLFPRPFDESSIWELLTNLAANNHHGHIVFETRAAGGKIRYLVGAERSDLGKIGSILQSALPAIRFAPVIQRGDIAIAREVKISRPTLALNTGYTEAVVRSTLASLAQTKQKGDETVLQVILGSSFTPSLLPDKLPDPTASWLDTIRGSVSQASTDSRRLMREKAECHGFNTSVRIGATANEETRAHGLIRAVFSGLKTAESAGAKLRIAPERPELLNEGKRPWVYPMRLSVKELPAFLCWPFGSTEFAGVAAIHPRMLPLPEHYHGENRSFGLAAIGNVPLGISPSDSLQHTVFLGPTGSGKSNAMMNLILADIAAGRSVFVLDPKSDLVNDILERIPEERAEDVVILDPSSTCPVGFNPLSGSERNPTLTADTILSILQDIFSDSWGVRTQDILSGALLTLARIKGSSLLWLMPLLTDDGYRRNILKDISDPVGLDAFWMNYEAMSSTQRAQVIGPVMNKLRQLTLRPELRNMLGQSEPMFQLEDIFSKRRIVLVSLNKGTIGQDTAKLLGSLLIGQLWMLALGRANLSPEQRHVVNVYIDEVQDYLKLPGDLSDALSQARGMGLGLNLAHQYRNQLPQNLKAAIDANCHNKIVFGLNAGDAKEMAAMAPMLEPLDFMLLPAYEVYALLQYKGRSMGWVSGRTSLVPPAIRPAYELRAKSMELYGMDAAEVEQDYLAKFGYDQKHQKAPKGKTPSPDEPIGRKKKENL